MNADARSMLDAYLRSQLIASTLNAEASDDDDAEASETVELPDAATLQGFKAQVQKFMELDDKIRKLQAAARELGREKRAMSDHILAFMKRYRIEDLNTRNGNLRYRMSFVKAPLSQKEMRNRFISNFDTHKSADEIAQVVFDARDKVPKVSLKRTSPRLLTSS